MYEVTSRPAAVPSLASSERADFTRTARDNVAALRAALNETWERERKLTERLCMAYVSGADSDTLSDLVDDVRQGMADTDRLREAVDETDSPRGRALDMAQRLAADIRATVNAHPLGRAV